MKNAAANIKVMINILTGNVKIISMYGDATYKLRNDLSLDSRLKNSLALLGIIETLKYSQNAFSKANMQAIQLKIRAATNNN